MSISVKPKQTKSNQHDKFWCSHNTTQTFHFTRIFRKWTTTKTNWKFCTTKYVKKLVFELKLTIYYRTHIEHKWKWFKQKILLRILYFGNREKNVWGEAVVLLTINYAIDRFGAKMKTADAVDDTNRSKSDMRRCSLFNFTIMPRYSF